MIRQPQKQWRNILKRKEEILSIIKPNISLIVFDTETTGLDKEAKIIQFSAIKYLINEKAEFIEQDVMDFYLNPEMKLSEKITELTGITDAMLESAKTEKVLAPVIYDFLESADVWAAYNKSFDLRMLNQMSERTHLMYNECPSVDVLEMARDIIPRKEVENTKLSTISTYLFPDDNVQFHSSIEDVRATAKVMQVLLKYYISYKEDKDKIPVHVEEAKLFINPKAKSQQRIRLKLDKGESGEIFWDIINKVWSCKSTSKAKKLFESIDMADVERQVLKNFGYGKYSNMDEFAHARFKYVREKEREKKGA